MTDKKKLSTLKKEQKRPCAHLYATDAVVLRHDDGDVEIYQTIPTGVKIKTTLSPNQARILGEFLKGCLKL